MAEELKSVRLILVVETNKRSFHADKTAYGWDEAVEMFKEFKGDIEELLK